MLFFLAHGESSTGVLHPLDGIGELCHKWAAAFRAYGHVSKWKVIKEGGSPSFLQVWLLVSCGLCGINRRVPSLHGWARFGDRFLEINQFCSVVLRSTVFHVYICRYRHPLHRLTKGFKCSSWNCPHFLQWKSLVREIVVLGCFACFIYVYINKIKCIQSENIPPKNKAHILLLGLELAG